MLSKQELYLFQQQKLVYGKNKGGGVDLSNSNRKLGLMPGSVVYTGENPNYNITITVIYYSKDFHKRETFSSTDKIDIDLKFKGNIWINIDGINDVNLIKDIGKMFDIDTLSMEDIANPEQRVKIDDRDTYILIILKMLQMEILTKDVQYEQLSLIIKKNILITFQETPYDPFESIRARLEIASARLRTQDISYLAYILIDIIVDNYLLILDEVENEIDEIESQLIESADRDDLENILNSINNLGFKGGFNKAEISDEGKIVQDADRIDSIGAIGIARCFAFGGKKGNTIYNPDMGIIEIQNYEEYRNKERHSINHFYEKLLKIKDTINTETAKEIAIERTKYMENFLDEFYKEWKGQA